MTTIQTHAREAARRKIRERILVVDDEDAIASTLAAILVREGYETATASSGEEAVEIARSFQPALLLSDIVMDSMSGIDAARQILEFLPNCKVLLVSGNAGCRDTLEEARIRSFRILLKPVAPAELLRRISEILLSPAAQDAP